ncbi:MAG: phosphate ABC transporter substrate-binding protein PstS [Scytolyngbya sp. HA4215-MV1]|nr:phosphate ABC transporter substrate-binding protein PstS [Scytolyngbya sp. HA4215-MV1]
MAFSTTALRRTLTTSALTAAIAVSPLLTAIAQAVTLNGAGATFPAPLYEKYISEFQKKNPDIKVNYQAIGSGGGIRQTIAGIIDFGGSDAAMTDSDIAKVSKGILLVPTAGGAVAVVYNLPGVSSLKLSQKSLAEIFAGRLAKWNDPKIAADNPGVNLPDQPIKTAVRADGSGTTFIFTNALSSMNSYFKGRVGVGTAPKWTTNPLKGRGNPGVAAQVKRTPYSIGYVEFAYAKKNGLQAAAIENKKGEFVLPSLETANKALSTVKFPDNFRVFEGNPSDGYPIVGLTWLLVYKQYDADKKAAMKKWINWVLTDGQELNDDLDYTRIPADTAQKAIAAFDAEVK